VQQNVQWANNIYFIYKVVTSIIRKCSKVLLVKIHWYLLGFPGPGPMYILYLLKPPLIGPADTYIFMSR
jgi:hypothetical protein